MAQQTSSNLLCLSDNVSYCIKLMFNLTNMLPFNGKQFKTSLEKSNKKEILSGDRSSVNLCTGSSFLDKYFSNESIFQTGTVSTSDESTLCTFTEDMFKETDEDSNPGSNLRESVTKETQTECGLLWDDSVIFNNTVNKKLPNDDTSKCKGKRLHTIVGIDEKTTVNKPNNVSSEKREPVGISLQPVNVQVQINVDLFHSGACDDVSEVVVTGNGPMEPSFEDIYRKPRYDTQSPRIQDIDINSTLTENFTRLDSKPSFNNQHGYSHTFQVQNASYDSSNQPFQSTFQQTEFKRNKARNHSESSQDFQDTYKHINNRHGGADMSYQHLESPRVSHATSDDNIKRYVSFDAKIPDKLQRRCSSEDNILNTKVTSKGEVPGNRQRRNIFKKWYLQVKEKQKETYRFVRRLNLPCSCSSPHTRCSCNIISAIAVVGKDSFWIGFINSHVIKLCSLKGKVKSQVDVSAMVDDIVVSERGDLYISCPRAKCIKVIEAKNPENACIIFKDFGGLQWYPRGLAVHPIDGTLVACLASECVEHTTTSTTSSTLMKFDTKEHCYKTSLVTREKCFGYPLRLSIRSDNIMILSDYGFQQITILDSTGLVLATLKELNEIQISPRLALHFNRNNEAVIVQGRKPTITVLKLDGSPFTTETYDVTELLDSTINAVSSGFNDQLLVGTWSGVIYIFKKC